MPERWTSGSTWSPTPHAKYMLNLLLTGCRCFVYSLHVDKGNALQPCQPPNQGTKDGNSFRKDRRAGHLRV